MLEDSVPGDICARMRIFLPLLCVLCAPPVHSIFDGTCLRKDPPPGALVLSLGSKLVLTCSGHVMVDGVKVRNGSNINRRDSSSGATPTTRNIISNPEVLMKSDKHTMENAVNEQYHSNPPLTGGNRSLGHTDTGYIASPTAHMAKPTSVRNLLKAEEVDGEGDYEEEEEEGGEGNRVTRGIKSRPQWKWNGKIVGKKDRDWGEITFERRGSTLSLSSVRLTDSGKYTCYYKGKERFSLKVIVADPPEIPSLSCYKRSPSSKIRCEWTPKKPVTIRPNCHLLLSKSSTQTFLPINCSYSSRASRCWCALDHNENELRTDHRAYLCVTTIGGNATSNLLSFTPLDILKPDPPSNVSVRPQEGQEMRMTVTWSYPTSWKSQNNYFELIYEMEYRPCGSSLIQRQKIPKGQRSYHITDAMPGVEYLIQLRTKDEYDGLWSDWGEFVNGSSWIVPASDDDLTSTMFPVYVDSESSGTDSSVSDVPPTFTKVSTKSVPVSPLVLWISGSFALLSVILAVYIFRHKGRFMSKLQSLSLVTQCGFSPQPPPSVPTPPEGQALVTSGPPCYKEPSPSEGEKGEEENEEEQCVNERIQATHFNNTSYFFL